MQQSLSSRRHLQVPDVGRDAEPPVQGPDGEVAHVALGRRVADEPRPLPRPRRPGLLVHRRHLGPEARHRVGDAGLLQLVDVADGPHRAVRAVAAARVVGALVDLQVRALTKSVREYMPKDILINNIRPYFKKIWYSDMEGGCSNDIYVLRSNENYDSKFLYYVLSSDDFFNYVMANAKGRSFLAKISFPTL